MTEQTIPPVLPETGFLRIGEVLRLIPVGQTTWWNGVRSGRYPKSVKLGPNITAWRAEDIRAYIDRMTIHGWNASTQEATANATV